MGSSRPESRKERGRRAVNAMKPLGFSSKHCGDVLKRLLELYDYKWELIEDENYRVLADAILDAQPNDNGDPQPELEQEEIDAFPAQGGGPSTSLAAAAAAAREDYLGPPSPPSPSPPTAEQQAPTTELAISRRADSHTRASTRALGKRRHRQMIDDLQLGDAAFVREPKPEPVDMDCSDAQPGLIVRSPPRGAASSSGFREPPLPQSDRNPKQIPGAGNRALQRCRNQEITTSSVEPTGSSFNNGTGSGVGNVQEAPGLEIDVASSAMGEVKMSLKCSVDPSKFCMPPLEAVFKMVEDKCLGSSKVLPPDFSVVSLMTEICQCVLQLGTEHSVERTTQPDIVGNGSRSEDDRMRKQKAEEELLVSNGSESCPVNSTPAEQQRLALSTLRIINHDVKDITKGEEKIRISIVNEFGSEMFPSSFYYIPQNVVFQNALVDMSLAKIGGEDCCADCFGNCLSAPEPCACARETGGEYAYTREGLVRPAFIDECVYVNLFPAERQKVFCETCPLERSRHKASPEPCRGHIVRKFIKECWSKCGCNMQCGNRVVQRGITCNLQVFFTGEGTGWGLRTLDELPKGAFVCEFAGEILTSAELNERAVENMQLHPIPLDAAWCSELKDEEALSIDGSFYGNVGRFINHRCSDANLVVIPVEVETPDHHYYHLAFFASKKVEPFEELTLDYGIDFETDQQPVKPFECLCGSRYCRGRRRHHTRKRSIVAAAATGEEG